MKKLLIGLTLLASMSSFATTCEKDLIDSQKDIIKLQKNLSQEKQFSYIAIISSDSDAVFESTEDSTKRQTKKLANNCETQKKGIVVSTTCRKDNYIVECASVCKIPLSL